MYGHLHQQACKMPSMQAGHNEAVKSNVYLFEPLATCPFAHFSSLNESARLGEIIEAVKALEIAIKKDTKEELAGKAPPCYGVLFPIACCSLIATQATPAAPTKHSGQETLVTLNPSIPVLQKVSKPWCASIRVHPYLFACIYVCVCSHPDVYPLCNSVIVWSLCLVKLTQHYGRFEYVTLSSAQVLDTPNGKYTTSLEQSAVSVSDAK